MSDAFDDFVRRRKGALRAEHAAVRTVDIPKLPDDATEFDRFEAEITAVMRANGGELHFCDALTSWERNAVIHRNREESD